MLNTFFLSTTKALLYLQWYLLFKMRGVQNVTVFFHYVSTVGRVMFLNMQEVSQLSKLGILVLRKP